MTATRIGPRKATGRGEVCKVCGSSAPITRTHAYKGTLNLCYAHEAVCWPHLEDPCSVCDVL